MSAHTDRLRQTLAGPVGRVRCQLCQGSHDDGSGPCRRCDPDGQCTSYDCDRCACEFAVYGGDPQPVVYELGGRQHVYCPSCAAAEALGDGQLLRSLLADLRRARAVPDESLCRIGHLASVESGLLALCEWTGVAAQEEKIG